MGSGILEVTCHFHRFTLVSNDQAERITIDSDIVFRSGDRKKAWVNSASWKSSKNASTAIHPAAGT